MYSHLSADLNICAVIGSFGHHVSNLDNKVLLTFYFVFMLNYLVIYHVLISTSSLLSVLTFFQRFISIFHIMYYSVVVQCLKCTSFSYIGTLLFVCWCYLPLTNFYLYTLVKIIVTYFEQPCILHANLEIDEWFLNENILNLNKFHKFIKNDNMNT